MTITQTAATADGLLDAVRRHDPDRFLFILLSPASHRETLLVLTAFHHALGQALAAAPARADGSTIALMIRLQWWREVIGNERADWRQHEVAAPLRAAIDANPEIAPLLLGMVDACEAEAEGVDDAVPWRRLLRGGAGALHRAMAVVLGVTDPGMLDRIEAAGAAGAVGAMRRFLPVMLRDGYGLLPRPWRVEAETVAARLRSEGEALLEQAGRIVLPPSQIAPALSLVLARRDLRRDPVAAPRPRGLGDRLAVLLAGRRGAAGLDRAEAGKGAGHPRPD
ncbi:squalene/phytoene synthase family protein [Rhizosaccharibacter radicis]|uniref:Squalene/phytoene synthase family protein n=1 Tax=Rhizosaccharibacter radicis TaxID=2782605 RepID=A0ABT1VW66_9PROT|nr:squalene/phytoene synthase family protein [Acetobacteraceae bacterium KSS12]